MKTASSLTDAESLLAAACLETGLSDFGDRSFVEPLTSYVGSVSTEAGLGPVGQEVLRLDTIRLLANRLRLQADRQAHPEIAQEDVSDPIVITGLPRTGTTKLHRAIAADPARYSLPFWLAMSPARIDGPPDGPDPRIAIGDAHAAGLAQMGPEFMAAHQMTTHEAEEEVLLLQMTFDRAAAFTWYYDAPSHLEVVRDRPQNGAYRYLKEVLQGLQWQQGGRRGKSWILKSPVHLGELDALLEAFPRATVVHCHRAVDVAMPSLCRLVETIRSARGVEQLDLGAIGLFFTDVQGRAWERNLTLREAHPGAQIVDLTYTEIDHDLGGAISRVYSAHGLEFSADTAQVFARWEREHPAPRAGGHVYSLDAYDLTPTGLEAGFASYLERFPDMAPRR